MLSDEEKKALKVVNKRTERLMEELKIEEEDLIDEPKIAYLITQIEANKTLVNLIEKQSKEIEELDYKNAREFRQVTKERDKYWEDKIKAKIEEYEDYGTSIYYGLRSNGKAFHQAVRMEVKEVLQSLLEKE